MSAQANKESGMDEDKNRLNFMAEKIYDEIAKAQGKPAEMFKKEMDDMILGTTYGYFELKKQFYDSECKKAIEALSKIENNADGVPEITDHISEFNSIAETLKIFFSEPGLDRYKMRQLVKGEIDISEEEIMNQREMRKDITEGRSLLQWHILQNESNKKYLDAFFDTVKKIAGKYGFNIEFENLMRGILQELGIYKMLKSHFKNVTPALPIEDAIFKIDFWAETQNGKKIIIQSKSSSPMISGDALERTGIFTEDQIKKFIARMSENTDIAGHIQYEKRGAQEFFSPLIQMKSLEQDIGIAKEYAESKGNKDPEFYLVVASHRLFDFPTGTPMYDKLENLNRNLKDLANS